MKKKNSILLFMAVGFMAMYSQSSKDKYEAINTYLSLIVKDTTKTVVLVKEKISANQALELFAEGKLNNKPFDRVNGRQIRVGGILEPLYDETDFQKMRKDYQDNANDGKYRLAKKASWNRPDFKFKNIFLQTFDTIMSQKGKGLSAYNYETELIALSDPMYYKGKEYLVIAVAIGDTSPIGYFNHYVVVMKKINNRWQVIQRGEKYWFD